MARNRVIYQSEGLYVSDDVYSTGNTAHEQLRRVQSANYSFSVPRQDINQYGQLARIDSLSLETPTVSLDFTYYATDGFNERTLGFYVATGTGVTAGGFASGHMVTSSGKNFFIVTTDEGVDLNGQAVGATDSAIGIGNGYLSDYTFDAAVGSLPTVSVTIEGLNIRSDTTASSIGTPAVDLEGAVLHADPIVLPNADAQTGAGQTITALKPGDIVLSFGGFETGGNASPLTILGGTTGAHIQSVSLSLPLSRTALEKIGSNTAYARAVDFPVTASISVNAIVNEIEEKNLVDILNSSTEHNIGITLKDGSAVPALVYNVLGCILQDESYTSAIGSNKSVDLTFTAQIGGPTDTTHNINVSGVSSEAIFS